MPTFCSRRTLISCGLNCHRQLQVGACSNAILITSNLKATWAGLMSLGCLPVLHRNDERVLRPELINGLTSDSLEYQHKPIRLAQATAFRQRKAFRFWPIPDVAPAAAPLMEGAPCRRTSKPTIIRRYLKRHEG
jgi:hypothetical protein